MTASKDNQPRTFHAYCIGDAKSGTSSLAGMFETNFRVAHEPEWEELLDEVIAFDKQQIGRDELDAYLHDREELLRVELDSSWANYFVMDRLAVLFPHAKFIQLVRNCYAWVESVVNHLTSRVIPPDVQGFMDWWFEPSKYPHTSGDHKLKGVGIYSLECYLERWNKQADRPSRVIPQDRLMTIRTHELSESIDNVAHFLGVGADLIDKTRSHRNVGGLERPLLTLVGGPTVARVCRRSMEQFFPEVKSVEDASALRYRSLESQ